MRRRWLGTPILGWVLSVLVVVLMVVVVVLAEEPATKFVAGLLLVTQAVGLVLTAVRSRKADAARAQDDAAL